MVEFNGLCCSCQRILDQFGSSTTLDIQGRNNSFGIMTKARCECIKNSGSAPGVGQKFISFLIVKHETGSQAMSYLVGTDRSFPRVKAAGT